MEDGKTKRIISNDRFYVIQDLRVLVGRCSLSAKSMEVLDLHKGDTVALTIRKNKFLAMVDPLSDHSNATDIMVGPDGYVNLNLTTQDPICTVTKIANRIPTRKLHLCLYQKNSPDEMFNTDKIVHKHFDNRDVPLTIGSILLVQQMKFKVLRFDGSNRSSVCVIVPSTDITFEEKLVEESLDDHGFTGLGGMEEIKKKILQVVEWPFLHPELFRKVGIKPPKGILLHGPPGTGKTMLAKAIAHTIGAQFFCINGPEIMSKMLGGTEENLTKPFTEASNFPRAIIFIDEIDSIAPSRDKNGSEIEQRVVARLLTLMDGMKSSGKTVVIGATNRPDAVDSALRRPGRFDREIEVGPPDEPGRLDILKIKTRKMAISKNVDLALIAKKAQGYVGADLDNLCKEAGIACMEEHTNGVDLGGKIDSVLKNMVVEQKHFDQALAITNPSTLRSHNATIPNVKWSDIGGLADIKRHLLETVQDPLLYADVFEEYKQKKPHGILMYGPPGTGKTLLAKAVANECSANFISVKGPELLSMWYGDSEKNVRDIFKKARQASPCILFFDELDSIGGTRGGTMRNQASDRVLNQLLTEMDGVSENQSVFFIGATNRPGLIDSALMRPGRLDHKLYVTLPDDESRLQILKIYLGKVPMEKDVKLEELVELTGGYSGADIMSMCSKVSTLARRETIARRKKGDKKYVQPFTMEYFAKVIANLEPSVSEKQLQMYQRFGGH